MRFSRSAIRVFIFRSSRSWAWRSGVPEERRRGAMGSYEGLEGVPLLPGGVEVGTLGTLGALDEALDGRGAAGLTGPTTSGPEWCARGAEDRGTADAVGRATATPASRCFFQ